MWPFDADDAMTDNPTKLRELMARHDLTREAVAELLDVKRSTVSAWLAPAGSPSRREMPDNMIRLALLELREARPRGPGKRKPRPSWLPSPPSP